MKFELGDTVARNMVHPKYKKGFIVYVSEHLYNDEEKEFGVCFYHKMGCIKKLLMPINSQKAYFPCKMLLLEKIETFEWAER